MKFIKNEVYTDVYSEQKNDIIHAFSIGKDDCDGMHYYSSSYHYNGNFAPANFKSENLLPDDVAKEKLFKIYKNAHYVEQPWSND